MNKPLASTHAMFPKDREREDASASLSNAISPIQEIIEEARNGRMFIMVDDEDRENEGDLIIPAQMATPDAINFMAKHGRGLICLALTSQRVRQLGLSPMSARNGTRHETAFTISIEAREGVSTGISAADRARTIATAIDAAKGPEHLTQPGHVFPLAARDGGVLVRAGHTEASTDVSRLAGLNPSAVICEIMNDDGQMARLDDLVGFALAHGLKIGTVRDLIAYRRRHDHLVECVARANFQSDYGGHWTTKIYVNKIDSSEQIIIQKGEVVQGKPTLVRVHAMSLFSDLLGKTGRDADLLPRAMRAISDHGSGVIVAIRGSYPTALANDVRNWVTEGDALRDYGIGAQILADLGVHAMILLTNSSRSIAALEGYGLSVVDERAF